MNDAKRPPSRLLPSLAALFGLAVVAFLLVRRGGGDVDGKQQPSSTVEAATAVPGAVPAAGSGSGAATDPTAVPARNAPLTETQKRAHDRAVVAALQRFQLESNAPLDQCLNAPPGPRVPFPLIVTFERQPSGTAPEDAAHDRFVAAVVQPAPRLGPPVKQSDDVGRCLQRLVGRPLQVDSGHVPPGDRFREVVNVLLPEARTPTQEMEKP